MEWQLSSEISEARVIHSQSHFKVLQLKNTRNNLMKRAVWISQLILHKNVGEFIVKSIIKRFVSMVEQETSNPIMHS